MIVNINVDVDVDIDVQEDMDMDIGIYPDLGIYEYIDMKMDIDGADTRT